MGDVLKSFEKYVNDSSWEEIAKMIKIYSMEFSKETEESKRLQKQLRVTKELLYEYLKGDDPVVVKKASFFRGLVKSIEHFEKGLETHNVKKSEFMILLRALLEKTKKQKFAVFKPIERRKGFDRMKEYGDI